MAVQRLDPRHNVDRVYQYHDYQVLSARFARRKRSSWSMLPWLPAGLSAPRVAIRLLPFKIALTSGVLVLSCSFAAMAYLEADTTRLRYEEQNYAAAIDRLEQSKVEAVESNLSAESNVLAGGIVSPQEVVYPGATEYVVLTNIPDATGKRLVEELYPLSKKMIRVEP
jgi:hypothetical protein